MRMKYYLQIWVRKSKTEERGDTVSSRISFNLYTNNGLENI